MSRVGKRPISIPSGIKVTVSGNVMNVEGAKAKLIKNIPPEVEIVVVDSLVSVNVPKESKTSSAMQGLTRSLLAGMIEGVKDGFKKNLEIVGVGYRAKLNNPRQLEMALGFSHPVIYDIPQGINVTLTDTTKICVEGADKQVVGEVAATIRRFKKPEPYKGKGIRYVGEHITMKEGKKVG